VLKRLDKENTEAEALEDEKLLVVQRKLKGGGAVFAAFHFGDVELSAALPVPVGAWRKLLDSAAACWGGAGSMTPDEWTASKETSLPLAPKSFVLYEKKDPPPAPPSGAVG